MTCNRETGGLLWVGMGSRKSRDYGVCLDRDLPSTVTLPRGVETRRPPACFCYRQNVEEGPSTAPRRNSSFPSVSLTRKTTRKREFLLI